MSRCDHRWLTVASKLTDSDTSDSLRSFLALEARRCQDVTVLPLSQRGSATVTSDPRGSRSRTSMEPPDRETIQYTSHMPRPLPW